MRANSIRDRSLSSRGMTTSESILNDGMGLTKTEMNSGTTSRITLSEAGCLRRSKALQTLARNLCTAVRPFTTPTKRRTGCRPQRQDMIFAPHNRELSLRTVTCPAIRNTSQRMDSRVREVTRCTTLVFARALSSAVTASLLGHHQSMERVRDPCQTFCHRSLQRLRSTLAVPKSPTRSWNDPFDPSVPRLISTRSLKRASASSSKQSTACLWLHAKTRSTRSSNAY
jgi:hypothetical protein